VRLEPVYIWYDYLPNWTQTLRTFDAENFLTRKVELEFMPKKDNQSFLVDYGFVYFGVEKIVGRAGGRIWDEGGEVLELEEGAVGIWSIGSNNIW
jgi:hypothetical protein